MVLLLKAFPRRHERKLKSGDTQTPQYNSGESVDTSQALHPVQTSYVTRCRSTSAQEATSGQMEVVDERTLANSFRAFQRDLRLNTAIDVVR